MNKICYIEVMFKKTILAFIVASLLVYAPANGATWDGDSLCTTSDANNKKNQSYSYDKDLKKRLDKAITQRDHDEVFFLLQDGTIEPDNEQIKIPFVKQIVDEVKLLSAAMENDLVRINAALANGVNPDVARVADTTWTPLMIASYCGYKDAVSSLLEHGAAVNAKDSGALYNAILKDHLEIAKILLDKGADPNYGIGENKIGHTPLMAVKSKGAACLLLKYNADPNVISQNGEFALGHAIDNPDVFKVLLGAGAEIKIANGVLLKYADNIQNSEIRNIIKNHIKYEDNNECQPGT